MCRIEYLPVARVVANVILPGDGDPAISQDFGVSDESPPRGASAMRWSAVKIVAVISMIGRALPSIPDTKERW